jgi:PST family polysaccharide transporter
VYAVAFVALTAMQNFNELGVSLAIVRWKSEPDEIVPTVTTISVVVSAAAYLGCFFGARAYASAMGAPEATSVVRVLALAILIDGFANTPSGLLQRQFRQGKMAIAAQAGGWSGTFVTVAMAWSGCGAMSLAVGQVVGALVVVCLLTAFAPQSLRFGFDWARIGELLGFGLPLAGSNVVAFAVSSVDQLVVGHMIGATGLGFYTLALGIASWPLTMFTWPVRRVVPAALSRLQHDTSSMRRAFLAIAGLLCAVGLPACLALGGSAGSLVGFVYGARWHQAAEPLIWLALLAAVRILCEVAYDYLVVLARSRFLLLLQLAWLLALIPALIAGTRTDGLSGAGLAEASVAMFVTLPCYLGGLRRAGIKLSDLGRRLWVPAVAGALSGFAAAEETRLVSNDLEAVAATCVTTLVIVALLGYRMRSVLASLRRASPVEAGCSTESAVAPIAAAARDRDVPAGQGSTSLQTAQR